MKEVIYNGNVLELYDSIDEMPVTRFHEYNRALLIDAGIGADAGAIDRHIATLARYIGKGDKTNADKTLGNLRQALHFAAGTVNPESHAFVALIRTINGRPLEDLGDEKLKQTIVLLSKKGLTLGKVRGFLSYVKKNWTWNWTPFSPAWVRRRWKRSIAPN